MGIALLYIVIGIVLLLVSFTGFVLLCMTDVKIFNDYNGEFAVWKFGVYCILFVLSLGVMAASGWLIGYGQSYITERYHKRKGRCL